MPDFPEQGWALVCWERVAMRTDLGKEGKEQVSTRHKCGWGHRERSYDLASRAWAPEASIWVQPQFHHFLPGLPGELLGLLCLRLIISKWGNVYLKDFVFRIKWNNASTELITAPGRWSELHSQDLLPLSGSEGSSGELWQHRSCFFCF